MAVTIAELRAKLSDTPRLVVGEVLGVADGTTAFYALRQTPVVADSYVITPDPDTVDLLSGLVSYVTLPGADVTIKAAKYEYTLLSDATLQGIADRQASFPMAMVEAIEAILARVDILYSFSIADKSISLGQVRKSYETMLGNYRTQTEQLASGAAISEGGGGVDWGYSRNVFGQDETDYAD